MSGSQPDNQEVIALKRKISLLENENKALKERELAGLNQDMSQKATVTNDDRNWMNSFGASGGGPGSRPGIGQIERPVTASSQNARVREVQEELKNERKEKKKLMA